MLGWLPKSPWGSVSKQQLLFQICLFNFCYLVCAFS
uniref:Uncharacterized protein n=1 Tax=Anguilla anguilla TaxID=7936 RepID=A0A0E9QL84_ANGAN